MCMCLPSFHIFFFLIPNTQIHRKRELKWISSSFLFLWADGWSWCMRHAAACISLFKRNIWRPRVFALKLNQPSGPNTAQPGSTVVSRLFMLSPVGILAIPSKPPNALGHWGHDVAIMLPFIFRAPNEHTSYTRSHSHSKSFINLRWDNAFHLVTSMRCDYIPTVIYAIKKELNTN